MNNSSLKKFEISFGNNEFNKYLIEEGDLLSEHLDASNSCILFGCRTGICGSCVVEIEETDHSSLSTEFLNLNQMSFEEREVIDLVAPNHENARLACQYKAKSNMIIRRIHP